MLGESSVEDNDTGASKQSGALIQTPNSRAPNIVGQITASSNEVTLNSSHCRDFPKWNLIQDLELL